MLILFRWLFRGLLLSVGTVSLCLLIVYYLAAQSIPDYEGRHEVTGLSAPVEIVRERYAVPHIFGETDEDVIFALGYAHAEDRLWQMTLMRRTAQGRLAEVFGRDLLEIDILMRSLGLYEVAQAMILNQSPQTQALLRAYSAGVNARIAEIQAGTEGRGAPEFFMSLSAPMLEPWRPADSAAINRLMAFQLSDHAGREIENALLALNISAERLTDIRPELAGLSPSVWRNADAPLPMQAMADRAASSPHPLSPVHPVGLSGASNAWAAAPSRSATGASLLAGDPHLGLSAPAIWMLARLELRSGGVIGATIPGIPGILIGRTATFGWSLTTSYLDDQDIYIERLNQADPSLYDTPDGPVPFDVRTVQIDIAGEAAETVILRRTRHGPVLPPSYRDIETITPEGAVMALSWTALDPRDRSLDAMFGIMRSSSTRQALEHLPGWLAPSQNIIMADAQTIAHAIAGRMPARTADHRGQGMIPAPGWEARNDWLGYHPFTANPLRMNPVGGLVINTNNRVTDAAFPLHISHSYGDTQRILRARELLGLRGFHTAQSFVEAQTDIVSPTARTLLPLIGRDLWLLGRSEGQTELQRRALNLLAEWTGNMSEHGPEPLIYAAWIRNLYLRLSADELGSISGRFQQVDPDLIARVYRNTSGAALWCDDSRTVPQESCADIAELALDDALAELTAQYGQRLESWRWGAAHQALQTHAVLGDIPLVGWTTNIIQPTSGGDNTLMRGATPGAGPTPYANVHGAGLRVIYDFADPDASQYIISTGQSGHPLSAHYDDLASLWRRGEYIPMSLNEADIRATSLGTTILTPR